MKTRVFLQMFNKTAIQLCATLAFLFAAGAPASGATLPDPTEDMPRAQTKTIETAVFAGGCFWGIEAVFEHVKGVTNAVSGYAGGAANTADYNTVSTGRTGHAESVLVTYDASRITYGQLLKIFFSVAHDPTELNRQGPDVGTQYRSAIFYQNDKQKRIASAYIAQLDKSKAFKRPIVTQVAALEKFYPAEAYHQDYLARNPTQPYIVMHDLPKLAELKKNFADIYVAKADRRD
jgi:peptide-methionine (S)-S-oxide reductase